jgi:hypothetical protein
MGFPTWPWPMGIPVPESLVAWLRRGDRTDMQIIHERFAFGQDSTLAEILMDGLHECFALEDERRLTKVHGETCIPVGTYEIKLRAEGGMHERYRARFPDLHRGMLWLQDVPGFQWVYYHIGNRHPETLGCPLTGDLPVILPDGEFEVARSEVAYRRFYAKVLAALDSGAQVFTTVREREPHP